MINCIYFKYESKLKAVDLGAHIGNYFIFMACLSNAKIVYFFEPNSESFRYLKKNAEINSLSNIELHQAAVGATEGRASLIPGPSGNSGMANVKADPSGTVEVVTLDDIISDQVDLIKIDTEGMAPDVLGGSLRILRDFYPDLYIECGSVSEYDLVVDILSPLGYEPKLRFNYTPTLLFEHSGEKKPRSIPYKEAVQLGEIS